MNPMPMDDEGDDTELRAKLLEELEALARGGQARDMASRLGKMPADAPPPDDMGMEGSPEEEAGESPDMEAQEPIPGAEPDDDDADPSAAAGPSPDRLRALLASLKSRG